MNTPDTRPSTMDLWAAGTRLGIRSEGSTHAIMRLEREICEAAATTGWVPAALWQEIEIAHVEYHLAERARADVPALSEREPA